MSKFSSFRNKMKVEHCCDLKLDASFITEGTFATEILHVRLNEVKKAGFIINNSEGPNNNTIYTYKYEQKNNEFLKGDYFIRRDKKYFVYEDIDIVMDTIYKQQWAYECNAAITLENQTEEYYGYFLSSMKKVLDEDFKQNIAITDKEKPMLIIPQQSWAKIGQKVIINTKPWKIIEIDNTTNANICYCSLQLDWLNKSQDIKEEELPKNDAELEANTKISFTTEDGYFTASVPIDIISRTFTRVVIKIPFGIDNITIGIKQNQEIITKTYKVVIK